MATYLTIKRGDTNAFEFTLTRAGVAVNITDSSTKVWFTAKKLFADADASAAIRKGTTNTGLSGISITDGANGKYVVTIAPADTSSMSNDTNWFLFDTQVREASGTISTVASGRLAVMPDTTLSLT